jgi:hypothetical protein
VEPGDPLEVGGARRRSVIVDVLPRKHPSPKDPKAARPGEACAAQERLGGNDGAGELKLWRGGELTWWAPFE